MTAVNPDLFTETSQGFLTVDLRANQANRRAVGIKGRL